MGWTQLNTWVRMTAPDNAVFIAQAAPWSPPTGGAVSGQAIWMDAKDEKDVKNDAEGQAWRQNCLLRRHARCALPVEKPLWTRLDDAELEEDASIR